MRSLSDIDRAQLKEILGAATSEPSDLAASLLDQDRVRAVVRRSSHDALTVLKAWVLDLGMWRDVARSGRLYQGIEELAAAGWVFETHVGAFRRVSFMPWELMPRLIPHLWDVPWDEITEPLAPRGMTPSPVWTPFIHDMFQFLSYARQEPLLLTAQNEVYRRQKTKLEKLLWNRPRLAPDAVVNRLLTLMDRLGFFEVLDHPYRLEVSQSASVILHQGPRELFDYLAEFIFDPTRLPWPVVLGVSLASRLEPDQTLKIRETLAWLAKLGVPGAQNTYFFNQAMEDLLACDLWDITGKDTGRLSDWAHSAMQHVFEEPQPRESVIQPTGEILVPPSVPLSERWALDGLAGRVKSDRVSTYRVDQASVKRGIQASLTAAGHIQSLAELTRNPIPENVRVNLEDWYRLIGRHRIMQVTVIHSARPEDSREVETTLGADAVGRLSPQDVIIRTNRVQEVIRRLDKAGAPILPQVLTPSDPNSDGHERPSAYHPEDPWTVSLPGKLPVREAPSKGLKEMLVHAARVGQHVSLAYQVPGESRVRVDSVVPVTAEPGWIQVYVISQRRYILVEWSQILGAELEEHPV